MKRIPMARLIEFGVAFMTGRGVPGDRAAYLARLVVETEAFRQSTHGLEQFSVIDASLGKTVDPAADPVSVSRRGASVLFDGKGCLGGIAVKAAREAAVDLARAHGAGFAAVRRAQWVGALGMHLVPVAAQGMLCQAWAQTSACGDCAPFGGIDPRFSTNPLALAFPSGGENPVVADFSTATMSMAGTRALAGAGQRTPTPRFLDDAGRPVDDPGVVGRGGTLMFMGGDTDGHKGYALSLFNEALAALAGGSANNPDAESHQSFSLLVLDPAAFDGSDRFIGEMRRFLAHVKSSRPRPGWGEVRLPGERGFAALADCRLHGVPVDDAKLDRLRRIAAGNNVPAPG